MIAPKYGWGIGTRAGLKTLCTSRPMIMSPSFAAGKSAIQRCLLFHPPAVFGLLNQVLLLLELRQPVGTGIPESGPPNEVYLAIFHSDHHGVQDDPRLPHRLADVQPDPRALRREMKGCLPFRG